MYKSLEELKNVIALGKPEAVVDMFLESYKQGIAYELWSEGKDLSETVIVVIGQDEDGNDITEEQLVNVYTPIDVSADMAQWKLYNYAILRQYPPMADYLDAVVKGDTIAQQAYIDKCLAVKLKYPKA